MVSQSIDLFNEQSNDRLLIGSVTFIYNYFNSLWVGIASAKGHIIPPLAWCQSLVGMGTCGLTPELRYWL